MLVIEGKIWMSEKRANHQHRPPGSVLGDAYSGLWRWGRLCTGLTLLNSKREDEGKRKTRRRTFYFYNLAPSHEGLVEMTEKRKQVLSGHQMQFRDPVIYEAVL